MRHNRRTSPLTCMNNKPFGQTDDAPAPRSHAAPEHRGVDKICPAGFVVLTIGIDLWQMG
jgi:hypothetical protein